MYTISKTFGFDAAHWLPNLPETHKCNRLHGHTYTVGITIMSPASDVDDDGFVVDFGEFEPIRDYIDAVLDHRTLNNIVDNPTSENLARHLYDFASRLGLVPDGGQMTVRVSETPNTWAEYRP